MATSGPFMELSRNFLWDWTAIWLTNEASITLGVQVTVPFVYGTFLFLGTAGIAISSILLPAIWITFRISRSFAINPFIQSKYNCYRSKNRKNKNKIHIYMLCVFSEIIKHVNARNILVQLPWSLMFRSKTSSVWKVSTSLLLVVFSLACRAPKDMNCK